MQHHEDLNAALLYLARRSPALTTYEPPPAPVRAGGWVLTTGMVPSALVVHGCSMVAVPEAAADLFVDVLHPAGCRNILLTGGVGRETPPLWRELAERQMTALFSDAPWEASQPPKQVLLRTQGIVKPVLDHVALEMPPEVRCPTSTRPRRLSLHPSQPSTRGSAGAAPILCGGGHLPRGGLRALPRARPAPPLRRQPDGGRRRMQRQRRALDLH